MLSWLKKLTGNAPKAQGGFRKVDWPAIMGRWHSIEAMAAAGDQTSVKQALLQADILLDAVFKEANTPGQTMGERLKSLKGKIPGALYHKIWQAHLKRNELVHEAGSFVADWEKQTYLQTVKEALEQLRGMR